MRLGSLGRSSEKSGSGSISPPRNGSLSVSLGCAAAPSMVGMLTLMAAAVAACNIRRRDSTVLQTEQVQGSAAVFGIPLVLDVVDSISLSA